MEELVVICEKYLYRVLDDNLKKEIDRAISAFRNKLIDIYLVSDTEHFIIKCEQAVDTIILSFLNRATYLPQFNVYPDNMYTACVLYGRYVSRMYTLDEYGSDLNIHVFPDGSNIEKVGNNYLFTEPDIKLKL